MNLVLIGHVLAQEELLTGIEIHIDGNFEAKKNFADTLARRNWIDERLIDFWSQGYLFSGLDSITQKAIYLYKGRKLKGTVEKVLIFNDNRGGYDTLEEMHKRQFSVVSRGVLRNFINHGYPFARISLDSVSIFHEKYEAFISVRQGPKIVYDSIALISKVGINRSFLANALEVHKGTPFSEKAYLEIPEKIERISFLELNKRPDVGFSNGKATIYLDLKQNSTNSFEGVLGLLPNQAAENQIVITGYIDLMLSNLFHSGKALNFTWNRFADQSQSLDIFYHHPYFLSSKIFLDAGFNLVKQDTSFLTQTWKAGIGSYLSNDLTILFNYQKINGNLIQPAPANLRQGFADYRTNLYAVGLQHPLYEQYFRLRKGVRFFSRFSLGDKNIEINSAIPSENYDSLDRQTLFLKLEGGFKYQLILNKGTTIFHSLTGGSLMNDEILNNELVRLGGLRTVRGFNENFFFAQHYALSRLELRQYFEQLSYFMVFYDQLLYSQNDIWDYPSGFGAGLALQTSNGLFSFALALGTSEQIPLNVSNIKIHLGYISRF